MKLIKTKILSNIQKIEIIDLWNNEYPEHLNHKSISDFENYLAGLEGAKHSLLLDAHKKIIAWYIGFVREDESWFAIIIDSAYQGQGLGSRLLAETKTQESELNGWVTDHERDKKCNGETYRSPLAFYLKNGFEVLPDVRLETGRLSAVRIRWRRGFNT